MEKISVIIPVYNVEKYLDRCVESVVNQTYENLEIILVDDGSTDNCPAMCDAWAQKDSRIKVIHKENGGASSARNAGLDAAQGSYVAFVDSDDYIEHDMFKILYNCILENNADICACNFKRIDNNGNQIKGVEYGNTVTEAENIILLYLSDCLVAPSCDSKLYKRKIIEDNNIRFFVEKKIGEDFLFNYFFLKNSQRAATVDSLLYNYYCTRDSSATNRVSSDMICRWKNTKYVINDITAKENIYSVGLTKYRNELLCCLRELLKSGNKELIQKHYQETVDEIRINSNVFLKLGNLSKENKLSIILIRFSPYLFKLLYSVFIKLRGHRD